MIARRPDGERIRAYRGLAQMTQRDLARAVGVGVPHISKIENGKERPSAALRQRLSGALGIDLRSDEERIAAAAKKWAANCNRRDARNHDLLDALEVDR